MFYQASHGIFYARSEVWIESERLYKVLYEMEVWAMGNKVKPSGFPLGLLVIGVEVGLFSSAWGRKFFCVFKIGSSIQLELDM